MPGGSRRSGLDPTEAMLQGETATSPRDRGLRRACRRAGRARGGPRRRRDIEGRISRERRPQRAGRPTAPNAREAGWRFSRGCEARGETPPAGPGGRATLHGPSGTKEAPRALPRARGAQRVLGKADAAAPKVWRRFWPSRFFFRWLPGCCWGSSCGGKGSAPSTGSSMRPGRGGRGPRSVASFGSACFGSCQRCCCDGCPCCCRGLCGREGETRLAPRLMPGLTSSKAGGGGEEGGRGDGRCRCRLSGFRGWRPGAGEIGRSRGIERSGIGENTDGPLATHAAPDR
eukprot:6839499-Alexandrium_andersonii.AAC.1